MDSFSLMSFGTLTLKLINTNLDKKETFHIKMGREQLLGFFPTYFWSDITKLGCLY